MLQQDSRALPFASTKHYAVLAAPEKRGIVTESFIFNRSLLRLEMDFSVNHCIHGHNTTQTHDRITIDPNY
jgi:hypothetical protein